MSPAALTILLLAVGTYMLKAAGPLLLGGERQLPAWLERVTLLLPAPLLAGLVATSTFVADRAWTIDARAAGLVAAALGLWLRLPFAVVVLAAAATTAAVRAVA